MTVGKLIAILQTYQRDLIVEAYEGEDNGLNLYNKDKDSLPIKFISLSE